ncbi:MAG TPA: cysteine desulfurase [Bacillus bacterium]|nr:cysteine desulfurase [Bacillus sp. (in: firmicutes)]
MKYFDYAASCPLDRDAADIFVRASIDYFGNSQSLHETGGAASNLLEGCRQELAKMLGVESAGVYFTSGGSEANFLGLMSLLSAPKKSGKHIITGEAEHSSVYNLLKKLETVGWEVTYLPLNKTGQIELESVVAAVKAETVLISIQHGNPEIGTIQPLAGISALCRKHHILLHSDCVQTFAKIPIENIAQSVDALSLSGHKFYGPKGVGAAYINPRVAWKPYIPGTAHEKGFRPGTVNVPGVASMIAAAQKIHSAMQEEADRGRRLRTCLITAIEKASDNIHIFGTVGDDQLSGIVGMGIKGLEGQFVMLECNKKGFAISTGTACHVGMESPARTMTAMGITGKEAKEFFRLSFGKDTKIEDVEKLATILSDLSRLPSKV